MTFRRTVRFWRVIGVPGAIWVQHQFKKFGFKRSSFYQSWECIQSIERSGSSWCSGENKQFQNLSVFQSQINSFNSIVKQEMINQPALSCTSRGYSSSWYLWEFILSSMLGIMKYRKFQKFPGFLKTRKFGNFQKLPGISENFGFQSMFVMYSTLEVATFVS